MIERFLPHGGGVESVAWQVAQALARAGDEITVVAREAEPCAAVRIVRVPVASRWQPLRVLGFSRGAARAAPRASHDVVHSFSRTREQDLFRAGGGSHADYLERAYGPLARSVRRLSPRHRVLLGIEARVFADDTQTIHCSSGLVRDDVARRYGVPDRRLVVLPNGVDLARFHPRLRDERSRLRAELGAGDELLWLFLGSGFARKGLDTALDALARTQGTLLVAGRDDPRRWRAHAEARGVASRVRWLGERRDVESLCAAADALLLPTRYDAFANASLEAAASGLPVVTSASNGAAAVLGAGAIVVARADDAAAFAEALDALLDPGTRRMRGEAARAAAEKLSWDAHAEALRALYRRIRH